jgi:hypothetical protein
MEEQLIYQPTPKIVIATNTFINVPIILRYEGINLIEVVQEAGLGYTTEMPIYHADGTYPAKAKGSRIYLTDNGKKAGLKINKMERVWACELDGKTLFEIRQLPGESFKILAELNTPDGRFVRVIDAPVPEIVDISGSSIKAGGLIMSGNTIANCRIGIFLNKNGGMNMGTS